MKPTLPPAARAFARRLGLVPPPAVLRFTMTFHAPKQGRFLPPAYRLFVDTTKPEWLTFQQYNDEPHVLTPAQIQVPVETTRFTLEVTGAKQRRALEAWAKAQLERAG